MCEDKPLCCKPMSTYIETLALDHCVPLLPLRGERKEKNTAIALKEHGHKDPISYLDINNYNRSFTREDSSVSSVHRLLTRIGVSATSKPAGMSEAHPGRKKRHLHTKINHKNMISLT